MKKAFLLLLLAVSTISLWSQKVWDTTQKIISGRTNSLEQQQKPYVIMISADGFRYDYAKKYNAVNLLNLSEEGVRAESMIPSYPSLTFPNHYSLVTGLYPSHHGLVSNYFYDRNRKAFYAMKDTKTVTDGSWYGGTPLWVLAEQQQMLSASFYWVGSEADIQGILPTYYYTYNEAIPIDTRINIVKEWLQLPADRRPHFITFYMPQVDHNGHQYGPDAPQTEAAVRWLDSSIKKLVDTVRLTGLPVNFIFVSDHGMTNVNTANILPMPLAIDTSKFFIPRGAELVELYAKKKKYISKTYKQLLKTANEYKVYLKKDMPANLHYSSTDDFKNRIGDILLIPNWPNTFNFTLHKISPGAHGFDPYQVKDMHATFYAWGPAFKSNITIPSFQNVNVYPIVTQLLGLKYTDKIDGSTGVAESVLK